MKTAVVAAAPLVLTSPAVDEDTASAVLSFTVSADADFVAADTAVVGATAVDAPTAVPAIGTSTGTAKSATERWRRVVCAPSVPSGSIKLHGRQALSEVVQGRANNKTLYVFR